MATEVTPSRGTPGLVPSNSGRGETECVSTPESSSPLKSFELHLLYDGDHSRISISHLIIVLLKVLLLLSGLRLSEKEVNLIRREEVVACLPQPTKSCCLVSSQSIQHIRFKRVTDDVLAALW